MSDRMSASSMPVGEANSELECFPYGVKHGDEGVCLMVKMGPYRILLDCGLTDISVLQSGLEQPKSHGLLVATNLPVDLVLCSHAHPDHAKGLLSLHRAFPQLPIYASEATTRLLPLNWLDEDGKIPQFCQALPWRSPVEFQDGLTAELYPAGHLPGAAAILLTYTTGRRTYTVFYTGDFFLSNSRLVEGLPLEELRGLEPDVLIIEGTYGTARHPHRRNQENQLAERINRAIASSYSVLLPTSTLGLGQEILMLLRSHHNFTGRNLDIWVDGSVAQGCDAYLELLPHFPTAVQNFAKHQSLFWDEKVRPRVRRLPLEQRGIVGQSPCIAIADNVTDLSQYCQPNTGPWLVLLPENPGHPNEFQPSLFTPHSSPLVEVETYLLAQHSDGPGTTQLIHNLRPKHVIFVHGAPTYLADLASLEELRNRYHLHSPAVGTLVDLPIGDVFVQPAAPETNYEGELNELGTVVTITLPDAITADPRWQGEDLVLRGLSPRELMNQNGDRLAWTDLSCCATCKFQRGQRCWNPESPLFGFKVTPDGYCPAYERQDE
jgi:Cft2 family RNA processing exonuclease